MFPILTGNKEKKNALLNAAEAFHLWDVTKSKYAALERVGVWGNFVHDKELLRYLDLYISSTKEFTKILEQNLEKYGLKGPDSHTFAVRTKINSDIIRDQLIAFDMFTLMQEFIEMLLTAIVSSTTNDELRALYIKQAKIDIDRISLIVKYLKVKGWLGIPPIYPLVPTNSGSKLDAGEAASLWSHLTYRYDNIQLTEIFLALANDGDFKAMLKVGQRMLIKQARKLEKELENFCIPAPVKPASVMAQGNTQFENDDTLFRSIFSGVTGALSVHAKALKQATTNDRIATLFKDLLIDEIDTFDKLVKFGKLKGWLNPTPSFGIFKQ
ncbi:DUF3231 family protein [Metallumcola ferriviriculae]|uniref:DUF3231 family protein n=1 Tax=Metallumcola ferriviriculae TaxID=3039180 RepID=A0AAU0UM15_9FIRM|nr:DUF3231 family protein [Desulfitibacteraceae bacterium MK1]